MQIVGSIFLVLKKIHHLFVFPYTAPSTAPQQARSSWVQSWGCPGNTRSNLTLQPSSVKGLSIVTDIKKKNVSLPELTPGNTWTISTATLWNCVFYPLIHCSSSGRVTELQISAGDNKRDFVLSWFKEVLCSAATAKLFELNNWDLLTLFLEVVPYSSLQATSLFHIR